MSAEGRYVPDVRVRIALLAAALVLAWIVARGTVQSALQSSAPQAAAAFWPANGESLAALARARLSDNSGEIDEPTRTLYREALDRSPALASPIMLAALDADQSGDAQRAERLMNQAKTRDPRSTITRFWLLDRYLQTGRYAQAFDEVGPALRLRRQSMTVVMTILATLANEPAAQAALAKKLATAPYWRTAFFQAASQESWPLGPPPRSGRSLLLIAVRGRAAHRAAHGANIATAPHRARTPPGWLPSISQSKPSGNSRENPLET